MSNGGNWKMENNDFTEISTQKEDYFMTSFKYYKSNKPKPVLEDVISVETCNHSVNEHTLQYTDEDPRAHYLGLKCSKEWQTFTFKHHPGLVFIKNPFTSSGQRYWIRRCLETYPRKPNKLNIDIEMEIQDWWKECYSNGRNDKLLKKLRWTTLGYHHNWDTKVYSEENKAIFPQDLAELSDVFAKYLGYSNFQAEAAIVNYYHMNSTLSAHTDHSEVNLEAPLFSFRCLTTLTAKYLRTAAVTKGLTCSLRFRENSINGTPIEVLVRLSDACYKPLSHSHQLLSLSFGQSAIFLIGGKDRTTKPSAIFINSGDVIVMSKEARLCYHAVPKILPSKDSPWNYTDEARTENLPSFKFISVPENLVTAIKENVDEEEWRKYRDYISEARININVRQVLNEKQDSL